MNPDSQRYVNVWVMCHLSSQACPCGSEVDLCDHRNSIRGDEGCGIPCCHEETEVLIVINHFVSYLNHISGSCVCPYVLKVDRKRESATYIGSYRLVATLSLIFSHLLSPPLCILDACNAALPLSCLLFTAVQVQVEELALFSQFVCLQFSFKYTSTSWMIHNTMNHLQMCFHVPTEVKLLLLE